MHLRYMNFLKYAQIMPQMLPFGRINLFSIHNEQDVSSVYSFIQKVKVFFFTRYIDRESRYVTITGSIQCSVVVTAKENN